MTSDTETRHTSRGYVSLGSYTQAVREANDLRHALYDLCDLLRLSEQQMRQISAHLTKRDLDARPGIKPFEPHPDCTIEDRRSAFMQWLIGRPPFADSRTIAEVRK